MNYKKSLLFILFSHALITSTFAQETPHSLQAEKVYEFSPALEKIVEKYQSEDFLKEVLENSHQFQEPDFIFKALHPREVTLEKIDALNKKVFYELPFEMNGKTVAICGCDLIGITSNGLQRYLSKFAIKKLIEKLVCILKEESILHLEEIMPLLANNDHVSIGKFITECCLNSKKRGQLIKDHLQLRIPFACLEYIQKSVTPPPFFLHGKTTEGKVNDDENSHIQPVTGIIPVATTEILLDPLIDSTFRSKNQFLNWGNPHHRNSSSTIKNIAFEYALEFGKQFGYLGCIDEYLIFIIAKEIIFGLLLFNRNLPQAFLNIITNGLSRHLQEFKKLLLRYTDLSSSTTLPPEEIEFQKIQITQQIEMFFTIVLSHQVGSLLETYQNTQYKYNSLLTGALLAPAVFKIINLGWGILSPLLSKGSHS